jgi:hypothetical protein
VDPWASDELAELEERHIKSLSAVGVIAMIGLTLPFELLGALAWAVMVDKAFGSSTWPVAGHVFSVLVVIDFLIVAVALGALVRLHQRRGQGRS